MSTDTPGPEYGDGAYCDCCGVGEVDCVSDTWLYDTDWIDVGRIVEAPYRIVLSGRCGDEDMNVKVEGLDVRTALGLLEDAARALRDHSSPESLGE